MCETVIAAADVGVGAAGRANGISVERKDFALVAPAPLILASRDRDVESEGVIAAARMIMVSAVHAWSRGRSAVPGHGLAFRAPRPVALAGCAGAVDEDTVVTAAGLVVDPSCRTRTDRGGGVRHLLTFLAPLPIVLLAGDRSTLRHAVVSALRMIVDALGGTKSVSRKREAATLVAPVPVDLKDRKSVV